jgi:hypothetical protein
VTTSQVSLRLSRAQIAKAVGTDPATVRTFERLVSGAVQVRTLTASGPINGADRVVLVSGASTVTLPSAGDVVGQLLTVKRIGADTVTVSPQAGQTIDGGASYPLTLTYQSITVCSIGTGWVIV